MQSDMRSRGTKGVCVFQHDVIPVLITRGAGGAEAGEEWAALRDGLNRCGRAGFRIVAVTEGPQGRAVIMNVSVVARRMQSCPSRARRRTPPPGNPPGAVPD